MKFLFIFFLCFFIFLLLLLQCKFANSTLLSLLRFSYFITPYDAQAFSAFSVLIIFVQYIRFFVKIVIETNVNISNELIFLMFVEVLAAFGR